MGTTPLSYTGMLAGAQSIARFLTDQGVGPGSVVALHLPNVMHFFPAYYGALFTGAAVTLINPLQPAQGLSAQLLDAGADTIVTHPAHLAPVTEVVEQCGLRSVLVCDPTWSGPANADQFARAGELCGTGPYVSLARVLDRPAADFVPVLQDSDAVAHYAYTGGTTGRSKGVRVLHRNVIANVTQMAAWRLNSLVHAEPAAEAAAETSGERLVLRRIEGLPEPLVVPGADVSIQVPPLFHAQGLATSNMFILGGVTIVLAGRFNPETLISLADRWQATYTSGNPPLFLALAEHCRRTGATIDSMRLAISGAAPLDSTALSRIAAVMPNAAVGEGYGLTESTCMITSTSVLPGSPQHVGSVGVPVPDTHVQIRGVDGVTELPDGHEGELWVRGPQVTDGYSHAPEQTAAQFIDGLLRTGISRRRTPTDSSVFTIAPKTCSSTRATTSTRANSKTSPPPIPRSPGSRLWAARQEMPGRSRSPSSNRCRMPPSMRMSPWHGSPNVCCPTRRSAKCTSSNSCRSRPPARFSRRSCATGCEAHARCAGT